MIFCFHLVLLTFFFFIRNQGRVNLILKNFYRVFHFHFSFLGTKDHSIHTIPPFFLSFCCEKFPRIDLLQTRQITFKLAWHSFCSCNRNFLPWLKWFFLISISSKYGQDFNFAVSYHQTYSIFQKEPNYSSDFLHWSLQYHRIHYLWCYSHTIWYSSIGLCPLFLGQVCSALPEEYCSSTWTLSFWH